MIPILAGVAATLAEKGLNLLANAVMAKGKDVIEEHLGVDLDKAAQTEEGMIKLRQLEFEHEEFLLNISVKQAEIDLKSKALDYADTANARDMNTHIQDSQFASNLAKNAAYYIDGLIISSTLILSSLLFFKGIPESNSQLAYTALGSLLTLCGTIVNFHRGTSARSALKDDVIAKLSKGDK